MQAVKLAENIRSAKTAAEEMQTPVDTLYALVVATEISEPASDCPLLLR